MRCSIARPRLNIELIIISEAFNKVTRRNFLRSNFIVHFITYEYCFHSTIGIGTPCFRPPNLRGNNIISGIIFIAAIKNNQNGSPFSRTFNSYFKLEKKLNAHNLRPEKINDLKNNK